MSVVVASAAAGRLERAKPEALWLEAAFQSCETRVYRAAQDIFARLAARQ